MTDMTQPSTTPAASKPKRPRPQVMRLTEAAAQRVQELTRRADSEIVGLRVGIKNGGCAGQSYTVEYAHDVRPTDEERREIDRIIMDELVYGVFRPESVTYFQLVIRRMKDEGCDGVVLGCTEIPLVISNKNSPLPVLDSTRLLAWAALRKSVAAQV